MAEEITAPIPETEPLPAVVVKVVHTAYFDANGKLLIITSGGVMDPPANAVNSAEVDDPLNYNLYYDGEAKIQQKFNLTITKNTVNGIPAGTSVFTSDSAEVVDDGVIDFDVNYTGTVVLYLSHPHYLDESISVEVGP